MASGLFFPTWRDILDTTQLAIDLDLDTHKVALFTASVTPDYSADTAYGVSPWDANEVSGTGYTAGGVVITGTAVDESPTGTLRWDGTDVQWTSSTITNARYALTYADALAGNNAIVNTDLGTNYSTQNGTFLITWASGGILTIDLTP
jgi:hypothetical protein